MGQVQVLEEWRCGLEADGMLLSHPALGDLSKGRCGIVLNGIPGVPLSVEFGASVLRFQFELGVRLTIAVSCEHNRLMLTPVLSNESRASVSVGDVELLIAEAGFKMQFTQGFVNGRTMVDNTGLVDLKENVVSNAVLGLTDSEGTHAFAAGAVRPEDAWYDFSVSAEDTATFRIICRLENTEMAPRSCRTLSPICLYAGNALSRLVEMYAKDTAAQMNPCSGFQEPPSGWCSWYHYYGSDDADEIRRNMEALSASPLKDSLQVIQIDDGWNRAGRDAPRNWGDWMPGEKYPNGMKALVDEIHTAGFKAGLWLAPFSVDPDSQLYQDHPDWLVQATGPCGELDPLAAHGGVFGLDLTRPDVQQFIRSTFRRVFTEWSVDYIKIDFLTHGAIEGQRFDRTKTGIEAFRIGMQIIREEAGPDRFILNCGSPIAASIGLCDGMRIGMDVGGRWFAPMNLKEWRFGNCCIKGAANSTIWRQWMHGVWWHNDPDCIVLRSLPVPEELKKFVNNPFQDREIGVEEFGLNDEERNCWLRLVWMSGGMFILSEDLASLSSKEWALLSQFSEPFKQPVCWVEQYSSPELGLLRTESGPLQIGLFNLSDRSVQVAVKASDLGLGDHWNFAERLSGDRFAGMGEQIEFPTLPPHAGRIWMAESL